MLKSAKSVGWDWDLKTGRDLWFGDLQTMFGLPGDTYVGSPADFHRFIHPDDRERVAQQVADARRHRSTYLSTFRVVWADGTVRWVEANGRFSYAPDGEAIAMAGVAADITERRIIQQKQKLAEQELASLSRKLLAALERERTRIARELHDDFAQRLTIMAIELDGLKSVADQGLEVQARLQLLYDSVVGLARDLQMVSHHLHSSKLEYVGLAMAAAGFCNELSTQHGVVVDFSQDGVPKDLPKDVALGLFRVLQEALTNAVKHSGVRHFTVSLTAAEQAINLEVVDGGLGFDVDAGLRSNGLGLLSMRERLHLLNGELSINSAPDRGTQVLVRVPVSL